jgi:hypothetical protein
MKKTADDKYRTSIYIDPVKILRLRTQYGLLLTPFVDRILDIFLEIPIDPEKKIIEEKMKKTVLHYRSTYDNEVDEIKEDHVKEKTKEDKMVLFGAHLTGSQWYPSFKKQLEKKELSDEKILRLVTLDVNKTGGTTYEDMEIWNKSIHWSQKFGMVEQ